MLDLGDRLEDSIIDLAFSTKRANGTPATLDTSPVVSIYKNNSTTETIAGITLTTDFDSITGLNHIRVDTSADAFYAVDTDYIIVLTAGEVRNTSVAGTVVATFSIEKRNVGTAAPETGATMIIPSQN